MTDPEYPLFGVLTDVNFDAEPDAEVMDFYARPDLEAVWQTEETEEYDFDPVTGLPLTECPVCGIRTRIEGTAGQICPVCGWEQDDFLQDAWEESAQNGGISLTQAQFNFRTFGEIDPAKLREGDREDAEF